MKRVKYFYNANTLRYEKVEKGWKSRLLKVFGFLSATLVFAIVIMAFAFKYLDSPKEKQLKRELAQLNIQFEQMSKDLNFYDEVLSSLQERDERIYRTIFEAEPIPASVREAGFGGGNRFKHLDNFSNRELLKETAGRLEKVGKQLYIQSKSYDEVIEMVKDKEEMFACIPAIQPVSNKDLKRMASGFGMRIHPIYKTRMFHAGCDFSAPVGTEIYATGKGKVVEVEKLKKGYGHYVKIDHGYGYESLYAHMDKIKVKKGEWVKRGDILGTVGNTGLSTAPHLHYEVFKNGKKIDPINFFYNDLSPEEFDEILEISNRHNQSFD